MKKTIKFLFKNIAIIIIMIFAINVTYGQTVTLNYSNTTTLQPGDLFEVPVVFNSPANVGAWQVVIYYNRDVITLDATTPFTADPIWAGFPVLCNQAYVLPGTSIEYPNQTCIKIGWGAFNGTGFACNNRVAFTLYFRFNGGSTNLEVINQNPATTNGYSSYLKRTTSPYALYTSTVWTDGLAAGPLATITATNSGVWSSASTWDLGHKPNTSNGNVIIANTVTMNENATVTGDLTINSGGALTVDPSYTLGLTGNFLIKSDATATGSFINNGTYAGTATVQRYISAYTSATDGWRFVSSPVGNTAIGNFAPGGSDDFFRYNEVTDLWENYMVSAFGFTKGMGYLAAYATGSAKSFTGTINDADVTISNQSLTPNIGYGWHLLGNPFSSSLKWDDGNWTFSNIDATAKVLNGGGTYTDLGANDIIPAMQGFLVQVTNASNAITIPAAARDHSSVNLLNKSTITERLKLTASSNGNNTYVESVVKTDAVATNGFDFNFDANFLPGLSGAPQLYTHAGNNKLSTNVLPTINNNTVIVPVSFVAGSASNYTLTADGINTFNCSAITLVDLKTYTSQDLMSNPVYNFTASASDNVNRFELYFNSAVGVSENNKVSSKIYSYNNEIFVNSTDAIKQVSIYNAIGQLIYTVNNPQGSFKYSLNGNSTGYYIVKVITDKNVNSEKVFVK